MTTRRRKTAERPARQGPRTMFPNKQRSATRTYVMTATGNAATERIARQKGISRSDALELAVRTLAGVPLDRP